MLNTPSQDSQLLDCTTNSRCGGQESYKLPAIEPDSSSVRLTTRGASHESFVSQDLCSTNETSVVCSPEKHQPITKPVNIYISSSQDDQSRDILGDTNQENLQIKSSATIQCRFNVTTGQDLRFKLRWLRSVGSSHGFNQSIQSTPGQDADHSVTITTRTPHLWTIEREGGLDLVLRDFRANDSGDYFCQAVSHASDNVILDEKRIRLTSLPGDSDFSTAGRHEADSSQSGEFTYSQENLSKLLPSLRVIPEFSQLSPGERLQLICLTDDLHPELESLEESNEDQQGGPSSYRFSWTFEPFDRSGHFESPPAVAAIDHQQFSRIISDYLPENVSAQANILNIWTMTPEHQGFYKCNLLLGDFNLSVQASAEVNLRPQAESAPTVFVTPELLRLSANGTSSIQCESSGFPIPQLNWYRVGEGTNQTIEEPITSEPEDALSGPSDGLEIVQVAPQDSQSYCHFVGCSSVSSNKSRSLIITAVSLIKINRARAVHQGQYVCKATNAHGTNQASVILDVEFKAAPEVRIDEEYRRQTITLPGSDEMPAKSANVTFRCSLDGGRPKPRLRWLRTSSPAARLLSGRGPFGATTDEQASSFDGHDLDIYDLTRVSSATSKVTTWLEDQGNTIVLSLSTLSVDDEGDYICLGENEHGRHSAVAHLAIYRPARVRISQVSPKIARLNESFQLDCLASGHPSPLDIEWSRSDRGAFFALISGRQQAAGSVGGHTERAVLKFDRISADEAGEYTCNARDALNSSVILRDTIMLLVEDETSASVAANQSAVEDQARSRQLPKLMVRPTKISAPLGSNVTLDCLAISGLQPTIVEWLAPPNRAPTEGERQDSLDWPNIRHNIHIRPYYRSRQVAGVAEGESSPAGLIQFGSKLRIFNLTRSHEGVYQCRGRNKIGTENAPALIKIADTQPEDPTADLQTPGTADAATTTTLMTKTKIAKMGSNIELRCQVNGMIEQPATSWSRDGRELPHGSVQIGHNLWIQNLTKQDEGLYLCSARSLEPNRIIQAKINLLVKGNSYLDYFDAQQMKFNQTRWPSLEAKVVASKQSLSLGDSVTLECILSYSNLTQLRELQDQQQQLQTELEEMERQVVWTNMHSGESVFQDNVYIQNNLLIIYDLRRENSATYRCNYNPDLSQHTDHRLLLNSMDEFFSEIDNSNQLAASKILNATNGRQVYLKFAPINSKLTLECPLQQQNHEQIYWTRGQSTLISTKMNSKSISFESVSANQSDLYQCHTHDGNQTGREYSQLLLVQPQQQHQTSARFIQRPVSFVSLPAISNADQQLEIELKFLAERDDGLLLFSGNLANQSTTGGKTSSTSPVNDYISLGLNSRAQLEFRFELGDGATLLRSAQSVSLGQWHRVVIERNRRGATMWLDGQAPVSTQTTGKFLNLNLDSILFVGGHQVFLSQPGTQQPLRLNGYLRGFQGCISLLKINGKHLDLLAKDRTASMNVYECDKPECRNQPDCSYPNGVCHLSEAVPDARQVAKDPEQRRRLQSEVNSNVRCICLPGLGGPNCNQTNLNVLNLRDLHIENITATSRPEFLSPEHPNSIGCILAPSQQCNSTGTLQCEILSSTSTRCHCRLGFMGQFCEQVAPFNVSDQDRTYMGFNQASYLKFRLANSNSFVDFMNVSLKVNTRASYGLIFYAGQIAAPTSWWSSLPATTNNEKRSPSRPSQQLQGSKSIVANQLARLSSKTVDYLAVALVDGHVELR